MRALVWCALVVGCARASAGDGTPTDAKPDPNIDAKSPPGLDAFQFLDAPNGCATQPCDIPSQCGCGTAMACDIDGSDLMGTACRAVTTMGRDTNTCSTAADCDRGYVCLGGAAGRSCKRYCGSNSDCTAPRGQCVIDITDGTNPIAGAPPVCSSGCDPSNVAAGGCPAAWKCGVFTATHMGTDYTISDCDPTVGTLVQGGNCKVGTAGDDTKCAADFMCTTLDGTAFACRHACNRTANTGCSGAQTCLAFNPALTIGGVEYGVCN